VVSRLSISHLSIPADSLADDARVVRGDTGLFVLLCVINLLNYIDRNVINGLIDPIRRDFGASDAQMGLVGLAFLLTYASLPPIFGLLGDRMPRKTIIAASVALWSVATGTTALVRRFWQLLAMRSVVGVGEASYMSNSPSLIADLFTPANRGRAMSIFYIASPVGSALGVALGGALYGRFGWRGACLLVGLPGLVAAALVATRREPVRGGFDVDAPVSARKPIVPTLLQLARNRTYLLLIVAYGGLVFTQNAIENWLPTVLERDKALPIPEATAMYGTAVFLGGVLGPLIGVGIADFLRRRDRHAYYHVSALLALLVTLPLFGIAVSAGKVLLSGNVFAEAFLGNSSIGIIITLIVAAVSPEMRSTATAVALTSVHVIGDVVSIPLVGRISTTLEHNPTAAMIWKPAGVVGLGPSQHLLVALITVAIVGSLGTATMFLVAGRSAARD
jgi:MFS transporter, Spinster family, sphingosine-1-phosphate transporter